MIAAYMRLLDAGMVSEAKEMETMVMEQMEQQEDNTENKSPSRLRKLLKIAKSVGKNESAINKTTESLRNMFVHGILRSQGAKKTCIHCKAKLGKVQSFKTKLMTSVKVAEGDVPGTKIMQADELRKHMRNLWVNDATLVAEILPVLVVSRELTHPTDMFFMDILPVPPPNVRPCNFVDRQITEHARTQTYKAILELSMLLRSVVHVIQEGEESLKELAEVQRAAYNSTQGNSPVEKLHSLWEELQGTVDAVVDREMNAQLRNSGQGLKQIIEKKAGIIRMHMMGKRVNYAARSVITPDPNLNIDEIGVPIEFAMCLTYPVPVTPWNVENLREMIMNGPKKHPGATMVEFGGKRIRINPENKTQQESILKRLLTPDEEEKNDIKIVHRHLQNGDVLLLNRQPTLHRPSIMAHTARVLKGEKTLRLHYSNCKAYNADFDGDEMNAHFPQNELARSEAYQLAHVAKQYLVPKDGTPLGGLIQDHVIAGVKMTLRGKFFTETDYQHLVYQAIGHSPGNIKLLPPSMIKPKVLYSGKQIISTVIQNIIPGGINLKAKAKIPAKSWQTCRAKIKDIFKDEMIMSEAEVVIREGQLLCGVLDKQHYGATPYGLVHCVYELYGGSYATRLLSSFAKLFTSYLQIHGFTLGVKDILVLHDADVARTRIINESRLIGHRVASLAVDADPDITSPAKLATLLEQEYANNQKFAAQLDRQYKHALDGYTNEINRACMPVGLLEQFPSNNLQLMVLSGAKGSSVNTMQISCCLGQIELEGKRPPRMVSGRTLPCFPVGDVSPRAGGFIDGRFMTGIQPPEFFFHCMAGREGLIDTAVKTSRSGYLQRCLVKHFEGLRVAYDLSVRDGDGSVVQYMYGEDGMDVTKAQYLTQKQLPFLLDNHSALDDHETITKLKNAEGYDSLKSHNKQLKKWKKNNKNESKGKRRSAFALFSEVMMSKLDLDNPNAIDKQTGRSRLTNAIIELWRKASEDIKNTFSKQCESPPDPSCTKFQADHFLGSLNDRLDDLITTDALKLKAMKSLAAPGEPVGLLAAQSIGEPSTQMTLNTFHFAGRGEMNVTLGIPRLREILMMASANIKTPSMEVPLLGVDDVTDPKAEVLRRSMTRVTVADILEKIDVTTRLQASGISRQHVYTLKFHFLPHELYKDEFNVTPKTILSHMTKRFFEQMFAAIRKLTKISTGAVLIVDREKKNTKKKKNEENESESSSSEDEPEVLEEDAKLNSKHHEKMGDQEPSDSEVEKSDSENEAESNNDKNMDEAEAAVVDSYSYAQKYSYDRVNRLWCELTFCLPMTCADIDLTAVLRSVASRSVISEVEGIKRAITYKKDDSPNVYLRTDGINMHEMFRRDRELDLNRLYSNDIHAIAQTYGIEAARRVIVKEVKDVFNVYGITIDPRHLLLIADYMTYNGTYEPLSRKGMESSASPLQQMSFESSLNFLKMATVNGKMDKLGSPSSCLMVGKPCKTGTGAFDLRQRFTMNVH